PLAISRLDSATVSTTCFCTPGMLISSYALLKKNPKPTTDEVKKAIEGNLCRCTGYVAIIKAILHASEMI
ncbi:(2Fe-2S)-binding protein, partial [archaeon]|nr:(2Fe-2S)-binding protein [archaeon]